MKKKIVLLVSTATILLSGCGLKMSSNDVLVDTAPPAVELQNSEAIAPEMTEDESKLENEDVNEEEISAKDEVAFEEEASAERLEYEGVISIDEFINQYIEPYVTDEAIIQLQVQHDYEGLKYIQLTVSPKYENDAYSESYLYIIREDTSKPVEFSIPEEYAEYVPFADVRADEYADDLVHIDIYRANIEFGITKEADPSIEFPEKVKFGDLENAMMTLRSYVSIENPEETGYRVLYVN